MGNEFDVMMRDLKPDLNNFLFSRVHKDMTIEQFEILAVKIYNLIIETWPGVLQEFPEKEEGE